MTTMRSKLLLAIATLAGCVNTSGSTKQSCSELTAATPNPAPQWTGSVFTIVMENKSRGDIIGNKAAPFINQLVAQGALAAGYHDSYVHPSEPNYIWMVAGENFGVLDDADPAAHHLDSTSHLADQVERAGLTWKAYQESMGAPCGLTSHGRYAAKHDPFVYFNDVNGWDGTAFHPSPRCTDHVVDYSQLDADLASHAVPDYVFITPNLDHDMHDGSVADGDAWLAREVPKLLASDAFQRGGVLFLLWDEGGGTPAADDPPFIAISPHARAGFVSQADYDHSSYLKTVQAVLGVDALPCDSGSDSVATMDDLFSVPLVAQAGKTGA
jgi:phosphatidylinositol-3-phosphatase